MDQTNEDSRIENGTKHDTIAEVPILHHGTNFELPPINPRRVIPFNVSPNICDAKETILD